MLDSQIHALKNVSSRYNNSTFVLNDCTDSGPATELSKFHIFPLKNAYQL